MSGDHPLVVVGFDGSEPAQRALDWAASEAKLRGARLRIVAAWETPQLVYAYGYVPAMSPSFDEESEKAARELVDKAARLGEPGVAVETEAKRGQAAEVLVEASNEADLLVVGSRGHGGFAGLLLGSVSEQCARHAACPVTIVR